MTNKSIARDFLILTSKGLSKRAFSSYVSKDFKHHNVFFKGDSGTLSAAMEESARDNPHRIFEVLRALEDGELVAVHSWVRQNREDPGMALVHIFRFESDRIVEIWDIAQPVPKDSINDNGMF
jgi:predicted SnoaL-like aldol condensation-catalyzing enzyme